MLSSFSGCLMCEPHHRLLTYYAQLTLFMIKFILIKTRRFFKKIFLGILIYPALIQFIIREFSFGFDNACNFLRSLNCDCIIPILRTRGATIGSNCDIQSGIVFHNCKNFRNLTIGDNCHIGKDCFFDLRENVVIGNNVVLSMRSTLVTHIDMTKSQLKEKYPAQSKPIMIHDNVYIGCGSTILMGSVIGERAFIAASSLVNKNIDANTLVAGVPVRKIKYV